MSLQPLKPLGLVPLVNSTESKNTILLTNQDKTFQDMLLDIENKLRSEFQTQIDIILNKSKQKKGECPSEVDWDSNVDRCRSPDGKFVKSECCNRNGNSEIKTNKKQPPGYYINLLIDKYQGQYILSSEFHNEVNKNLNDVGIPIISPQQIRIFVNLNGYNIVKMNGQNTYKFLC